jgi:RNase P protein component
MKPGYDLVVVARNGLPEAGAKPLEQRMEEVLQREGLLDNDERRSDPTKDVGK